MAQVAPIHPDIDATLTAMRAHFAAAVDAMQSVLRMVAETREQEPMPIIPRAEVARMLGVHPATIIRMEQRGELAKVKVGRECYCTRESVERRMRATG